MSNAPQPPADGWQPPQQSPQQSDQPVYRPNEQPPTEEPPPWSPESQRMQQPMSQQVPVEDVDGTVKYDSPGSQPPFGPPPGVPVSPFDSPSPAPAAPFDAAPLQPPVSGMPGMPVSGMPPVSSVPASGMPASGIPASGVPVSPGQGQFGPQGGHLVPVSGTPGNQQPWGGAQPIQRKKKRGGKGPMWLLLIAVVVVAAALAVGGFIIFNPSNDEPRDEASATAEEPPADDAAEPMPVTEGSTGLKFNFNAADGWAESSEAPSVFTAAAGVAAEDGSGSAFIGQLDAEAIGAAEGAKLQELAEPFQAAVASALEGEVGGSPEVQNYWIDAHQAQFHTFEVGDQTVIAALVQVEGGYEGFIGTAQGEDPAALVEEARTTLTFGEL